MSNEGKGKQYRIRETADSAAATALHLHNLVQDAYSHYDQHAAFEELPPGATFLGTVVPLIKQAIFYTALSVFVFMTSVALYAALYWMVMPEPYATQPIFFDYNYRNCGSEVCPPTAFIDLASLNNQWEAHVADVLFDSVEKVPVCRNDENGNDDDEVEDDPARMNASKRILIPKTSYFIQVALTLPESKLNRRLGVFMVEVSLLSQFTKDSKNDTHSDSKEVEKCEDTKLLATSTRPAMLPFQSNYVSSVKKSVIMLPLVLEAIPEARTVVIECFNHFKESVKYPMTLVEIRLVLPNQERRGIYENIEVLKGELRIGNELLGLAWFMKEWFYSSAFLGVTFFIVLQLFCFVGIKLWMYFRNLDQESTGGQPPYNQNRTYGSYDLDGGNIDQVSYLSFDEDESSAEIRSETLFGPKFSEDDSGSNREATSQSGKSDNKGGKFSCDRSVSANNEDSPKVPEEAVLDINETEEDNEGKHPSSEKKKKRNLSSNKSELRTNSKQGMTEYERAMADRVMKGDFTPYEIFTDLDEPDP